MVLYGYLWLYMVIDGYRWLYMVIQVPDTSTAAWPVAQTQLSGRKAVCCGQFGLHQTLEHSYRASR